ncbi:unnamed protein product [Pseudo-nitzschia multistriata]|uniref:Uncharacterized protein n=1 Tax=Pseudo-nitzschia multistriata TaxID=183589 RepID=A0A448ZKM6_9STRA|nr:unnamed protein product [Pseudo-nitzschia multistriata]VEU42565.1 unnamed protein product [Pseudo-nitzschia multistriata]
MSDARNSSNNLRGGGARQTGGSGRTSKYAQGNHKTELLGQAGLAAHQDRSEAKRKLQLQLTSKQLAADVRKMLLEYHTEEEYRDMEIPLPSTEDAKKKLQAMKEFTQKWYDREFREEWLQTVTEVWLEELKEKYEEAVRAAMAARNPPREQQQQQQEGEAMSIEELQEHIAGLPADTPPEERQRLKKKLKRKKQRAKEKEKARAAPPAAGN